VEEVAKATDLTKKQAEVIVESVFDGIIASLRAGEKIELRGFGASGCASAAPGWPGTRRGAA